MVRCPYLVVIELNIRDGCLTAKTRFTLSLPDGPQVVKTYVRTKSGRLIEKTVMMTEEEYKQFQASGGDPEFLKKFLKLEDGEVIEDWEKASTVYDDDDPEIQNGETNLRLHLQHYHLPSRSFRSSTIHKIYCLIFGVKYQLSKNNEINEVSEANLQSFRKLMKLMKSLKQICCLSDQFF